MEFGKSFTFMFDDGKWVGKILLAAVIAFIPIIGPLAVAGWGVEITKRVIHQDPEQLPDWSDFVNYLIKGLVVILIGFVYMLPILLVQACSSGTYFLGQEFGEEGFMMLGNILLACFGCLFFFYTILVGFLIAAAIGKYADTGEIGSAFRFGEVFVVVKAAPMAYLLVVVGTILASFLALFGILLCFIGLFLTFTMAGAITAHLEGQAYLEAKMKLEGSGDVLEPVA